MLNVVAANRDAEEGRIWTSKLSSAGYAAAPLCTDLSELVCALAEVNAHIVICSVNLVESCGFSVLKSIQDFFPRVKIVVVGAMTNETKAEIMNNLTGVTVRNVFGTDLERYWDIPLTGTVGDGLDLLLDEHFLSDGESAELLSKTFPKGAAAYAVLCVTTDTREDRALEIITETLREMKRGVALQIRPCEICVVADGWGKPLLFRVADAIRNALLKKTGVAFSIGISRERAEASMLYACRKEALRAASARYLYGINSVAHIEYISENDIEYVYPEHKEKRMLEHAMDGNRQAALRLLDEIFAVIKKTKIPHQNDINKIGLKIMVRLNIAAVCRAKTLETAQTDVMTAGKLLAAKTTDDVYIFLKNGLSRFADEIDALIDLRRDALYMKMLKLKEEKGTVAVSELINILHTTVGFLNQSVTHNTDGNIFNFIGREADYE